MHGSSCCHLKPEPNGSKAVSLLLRLSTLALALISAVVMATASTCTVVEHDGSTATVTYRRFPPFVYLAGANIIAAVLEAVAIYLQLSKGGDDDDDERRKLPAVVVVIVDVAVQALLYSATGAVFAAVIAYGPQITVCAAAGAGAGRFCDQVRRSKILSLAASFAVGLAVVVKDVALPFSVWPNSAV